MTQERAVSIRGYWPSVTRSGREAGRRPVRVPQLFARRLTPELAAPRRRGVSLLSAMGCFGLVFAGGLALAQTAGVPLPSLAPPALLDLQPMLQGAVSRAERLRSAGLSQDQDTSGAEDKEPDILPPSPVTVSQQAASGDDGTDARARFDKLRDEREARRTEQDADKKTRLAAEARPFADDPFGLTGFEDTVRGRARPDFESFGFALDTLWRGPLEAANLAESEPLADNPTGLEFFVGGGIERGFSSNALRDDANETSDGMTLARTRVDLISNFDLWSLSGSFRSESAWYDSESSEDYNDFAARLGFSTEYEDFLLISGEGRIEQGHIERGSIDDVGAVAAGGGRNDVIDFTRSTLAGRFVLGQADGFFLRPQAVFRSIDYDDIATTAAVTGDPYDSSDFDRNETVLSLRAGKRLLRRQSLFLEGRYTISDFENAVDRFGLNRDSNTITVTGGVELEPSYVTALDLEAGYFNRTFDDSGLDDVDGMFLRSQAIWNPTPVMTLTGTLNRKVESTLSGAGGSTIRTDGTLRLDWDPRENLILSAYGAYADNDLQGEDRTEEVATIGLEADYLLNEYIFISARADRLHRDSSIDGFDFSETRAFLEVGIRFCCQSENGQAGFLPRSYP